MDEEVFLNNLYKDNRLLFAFLVILPALMFITMGYAIRGRFEYPAVLLVIQAYLAGLWVFMVLINNPKRVKVLDEGVKMEYPIFKEKFVQWSDIEWLVVYPSRHYMLKANLKVSYLATPVIISYEASLALGQRYEKALGSKPMNQVEFYRSKKKMKGSPTRKRHDHSKDVEKLRMSDRSISPSSSQNIIGNDFNSVVEVKGVSSKTIMRVTWMTRGFFFINFGLIVLVLDHFKLMHDVIPSMGFLIFMAGIFLPISMVFSRMESRNLAPVRMDMIQIELKNDLLDEMLRRRKVIPISEVEKLGLFEDSTFQMHYEAGENPLRLVIYTKDGKFLDTGVKERHGINQTMRFLESRGIPIIGLERL